MPRANLQRVGARDGKAHICLCCFDCSLQGGSFGKLRSQRRRKRTARPVGIYSWLTRRLSSSGKAKIAAAALEEVPRQRKISRDSGLILRSDNGLIFGTESFVRTVRRHGVKQEFIRPYSSEQSGMLERFFRSLKEECVWQHNFRSRDEAFEKVADWMDHYNEKRTHSALSTLNPVEYALK